METDQQTQHRDSNPELLDQGCPNFYGIEFFFYVLLKNAIKRASNYVLFLICDFENLLCQGLVVKADTANKIGGDSRPCMPLHTHTAPLRSS